MVVTRAMTSCNVAPAPKGKNGTQLVHPAIFFYGRSKAPEFSSKLNAALAKFSSSSLANYEITLFLFTAPQTN